MQPSDGISEPPCKLQGSEESAPSYPLTLKQWKFLYGKSAKADEERIHKKANRLGERINNLVEDIVALQYSDSLEDEIDWDQIWENTIRERHRPTMRHTRNMGLTYGPNADASYDRNRGLELGRVFRLLCESADGSKREVLKGFIRGFMIDSKHNVGGKQEVEYEVRDLDEEGAFQMLEPTEDRLGDVWTALEDTIEIIEELIDSYQVQPFLSMHAQDTIDSVVASVKYPQNLIDKKAEEADITVTETAREEMLQRIDYEAELFLRGEKRERVHNRVNEVFEEFNKDERLKNAEHLAKRWHEDIRTLKQEKWRSVDGWDIFRDIASSEPVQEEQLKQNRSSSGVGYLLGKLSGEKKVQAEKRGQQWATRPVIEESANGEWETTSYGQLLHEVVVKTSTASPEKTTDREQILDLLHKHILTDDEVQAAADWIEN